MTVMVSTLMKFLAERRMPAKRRSKLALFFAIGYILLAITSLAWVFISDDSLAGVLAVIIIEPWGSVLIWLMDLIGFDSVIFNVLFMLGGALLNMWMIYTVIAWAARKLGVE